MATPEVKLQFISSIFESFRGTRTMESDDLGLVLNGVFRMFKDGVVLPQCMPKGTAEHDGWLAKLPQRVENGTAGRDEWLAKLPQRVENGKAEHDGWLAKLPQRVENGTEGHEKWLAKLPQRVENGTEGHEKWLAKLPSRVEYGTDGHEKWLAKTRGHYTNKHAEEHKDGTYLATCLECSAGPITIDDKVSKVKKRVKGKSYVIKGTYAFLTWQTCQKCRKRHWNWRIEIKATAPVAKKTVVKKAAPRKHSLSSLFCILHERKLRAGAPLKHNLFSLFCILHERKLREQAVWHH